MNMNKRFWPLKALGILLLVIIGVLAFGSIVMVLWNALMPEIFHLPLITFWQALGIFALAKILFGGFRGGPKARWKRDSLKEGWAKMTPEQQEKFSQEWGRRCGKPFMRDRRYNREDPASHPDDQGSTIRPNDPNTTESKL
jgi:hypothetical protein